MAKFKSGWFVMELWQTGNVGSRNIQAVSGQPEDGFSSSDKALAWMIDEYNKAYYPKSFATYTPMLIYTPINTKDNG